MPDGIFPLQFLQAGRAEDLRDQPDILMHAHGHTIRDGNAGGLLAAVLEGEQAEVGHGGNIFIRGKDTDEAALFVGGVSKIISHGFAR